jgi:hypothetical protein
MSFGYTVTPKIHPTHLSPRQSTLSVGTVETIPVHELDIPSASREYRNVDLNKQKRQDSVRSFQTLQVHN